MAAEQAADSGGNALLITGPASSGKSTVGQRVSLELGWVYISEDEYWVRNGWGSGLRSVEQEDAVQQQVLGLLLPMLRAGRSAVLEFILYKPPPNPMTAYQAALHANATRVTTIALTASVEEILRRMRIRGRRNDLANPVGVRQNAEHQVSVLASVDAGFVVDSTHLSVDETVREVLQRLGR